MALSTLGVKVLSPVGNVAGAADDIILLPVIIFCWILFIILLKIINPRVTNQTISSNPYSKVSNIWPKYKLLTTPYLCLSTIIDTTSIYITHKILLRTIIFTKQIIHFCLNFVTKRRR